MNRFSQILVTGIVASFGAGTIGASVQAQQGAVITDNWNKGGCGLTDIIRFTLDRTTDVGRARTWINWPAGVPDVAYTLVQNGAPVLNGRFRRNSCDPYQQTWCEGIDDWKQRLGGGEYVIVTGLRRVCQNGASDGEGFLALYQATAPVAAASPVPAVPVPKPGMPAQPVPVQPVPAQPLPGQAQPAPGEAPNYEMIRHGVSIGGFDQRKGPFVSSEGQDGVEDFSHVFATTQGIIKRRPSGVVNASGYAMPGDVDVVLFAIRETGDVTITARPCSRSARLRLFDLEANLLGENEEFGSGYYGLYSQFSVPGLTEGVYAIAADYPDGSVCDGSNHWVAEFSGPLADPIDYVGPFEEVPDFSVNEGLNVDDLLTDIRGIIGAEQ